MTESGKSKPGITTVRKGNLNRLTIAADRIEIKLKPDVTPDGEAWLIGFTLKIVEDALVNLPTDRTMRGRFKKHKDKSCISISMGAGHGKEAKALRRYHSEHMGLSAPPESLS